MEYIVDYPPKDANKKINYAQKFQGAAMGFAMGFSIGISSGFVGMALAKRNPAAHFRQILKGAGAFGSLFAVGSLFR